MATQEVGQITPLTQVEKVRVIRLKEYNLIRSFVESSLKDSYLWRVGYEYKNKYVWIKDGRWTLTVFKNVEITKAEKLPARGMFKVTIATPFAILSRRDDEVMFVLLPNREVGMLYGRVIFTREAPVAFTSMSPFSRLIPVYEVLDVLNNYVSFQIP